MFVERLKRNFRYDNKELLQMSLTALAFGLLMALRSLESGPIDQMIFLRATLKMFIISFIVMLIHFSFEKLYAVKQGIEAKYVFNPAALVFGLYIGAIFFNVVYFLSPGYMKVTAIKRKRIGKFRHRMWFQEFSSMAMTGIIGTLVVAGIMSSLMGSVPFVKEFIEISLFVAVLSLIPIPRNDGFHIFFGNWFHYVFIIVFTVAFISLLYLTGLFYTLLFSTILGMLAFFYFFDKNYK